MISEALNIILVLPVGTASVERSFSYVKPLIRNSVTDQNLGRPMRLPIECPKLLAVNFHAVLVIFQQKIEELCFDLRYLIIRKNFALSYRL